MKSLVAAAAALLVAAAACSNAHAAQPPAPAAKGAASQPATPPSAATARGTTPADREAIDADGVVRRGGALTKDAPAVPVATAFAQSKALAGKNVKVSGTVDAVCAKKGCWFVVKGDKPEQTIRITAKDYGFFVPKAAKGQAAVVEGLLEVKTLDQATAQHYEDERPLAAGEQRKKITGDTVELSIVAAALELKPAT